MSFEVFDKRRKRLDVKPTVVIRFNAVFGFNNPAMELMGSPEALLVLFDSEERLIGFTPSTRNDKRAFPIRGKEGQGRTVSAKNFLVYYGIDHDVSRAYPVEWTGEMLVVDLKAGGKDVSAPPPKKRRGSGVRRLHASAELSDRMCANGERCVRYDEDDPKPAPAILAANNPGPLCEGCQRRAGVA